MGRNTKIDWCDSTWNPVTGCRHGCDYCYARGIAKRFGGHHIDPVGESTFIGTSADGTKIVELEHQLSRIDSKGRVNVAPYPFEFTPTLHRYHLDQPQEWKEPRNIFVCSMADLFGEWVPDEWIQQVIDACAKAPQHRYMFLTKNPARYVDLFRRDLLPMWDNMWYGTTTPTPEDEFFYAGFVNTFVSVEPILAPFVDLIDDCDGVYPATKCNWIIIGSETGNRKNKVVPEKHWIMELVECAQKCNVPVFMKESLRDLMGADFRQETPWEVIL